MHRTGVPTLGVIPWIDGLSIDAEDSLALAAISGRRSFSGSATSAIDVAVVRFPHISNFTDIDALALEPGIALRLVSDGSELGRPDLVILPGSKSTVADLAWMRANGLAGAVARLSADAGSTTTVLGICGGFQMLGVKVDDQVESSSGVVTGLGLLAGETHFVEEKITRRVRGTAWGLEVSGYEIHHGRTSCRDPWIETDSGPEGGSAKQGAVLGTSIHGIFEGDALRRHLLSVVAQRSGKAWTPGLTSFAEARSTQYESVADAIEAHLDMAAVEGLISQGYSDPASRRRMAL